MLLRNRRSHAGHFQSRAGFSLLEILLVVLIIGLLAALAVQSLLSVRRSSVAATLANDLRVFSGAFETYMLEKGAWPKDAYGGAVPEGMEGRLTGFDQPSSVGGLWDWDAGVLGFSAGITLVDSSAGDGIMRRVDERIDDGNLGTGRFQKIDSARYSLILEP